MHAHADDDPGASAAANALVAAAGSEVSTGAEPTDAPDAAAWVALWRRVRSTRETLRQQRESVARIEAAFAHEIAPRERRFTAAVLTLTSALVDRYAPASLDAASRSLLGLWINENLERLQDHPFADADAVRALRRRWRGALAPDTRDAAGRALNALADRADASAGGSATQAPEASTAAGDPPDVTIDGSEGDSAGEGTGDRSGEPGDAADGRRSDPGRSGGIDMDALLLDADQRAGTCDPTATLIARLFRRLAQALHPDREPNAEARRVKQTLMGDALRARAEADLDRLLSLHLSHVGDPLDGADARTLERALQRQLEGLRRALARAPGADPLRRRIVDRYSARSPAASDAAIARHAAALDGAIREVCGQHAALEPHEGLQHALVERRERELDRLAIDELTGLAP